MRPAVSITILLVVIVACGIWLTWFYAGGPAPGEPVPSLLPVACDACGAVYRDTIGRQPAKCRKCGEQRVWRALKCYPEGGGCGKIFPMVREDERGVRPDPGACPNCGSSSTGDPPADEVPEP